MTKKAFVLINTAEGKARVVSDSIKQRNGVVSAHTVTGPYDVIAVVEAEDFTEMGNIQPRLHILAAWTDGRCVLSIISDDWPLVAVMLN